MYKVLMMSNIVPILVKAFIFQCDLILNNTKKDKIVKTII